MKSLWVLLVLVLHVCCQSEEDDECDLKLVKLADEVGQGKVPSSIEDISILLYSGKTVFDMGSKELCDLTP